MPMELGQFISEAMYRSKLHSVHQIVGTACIRAINVRKGEEEKVGSTWKVRIPSSRADPYSTTVRFTLAKSLVV